MGEFSDSHTMSEVMRSILLHKSNPLKYFKLVWPISLVNGDNILKPLKQAIITIMSNANTVINDYLINEYPELYMNSIKEYLSSHHNRAVQKWNEYNKLNSEAGDYDDTEYNVYDYLFPSVAGAVFEHNPQEFIQFIQNLLKLPHQMLIKEIFPSFAHNTVSSYGQTVDFMTQLLLINSADINVIKAQQMLIKTPDISDKYKWNNALLNLLLIEKKAHTKHVVNSGKVNTIIIESIIKQFGDDADKLKTVLSNEVMENLFITENDKFIPIIRYIFNESSIDENTKNEYMQLAKKIAEAAEAGNQYGHNQNGNNQYANNQYGNNQYGNNPYGNNQHGYNQNGTNPYASNPYGHNQNGYNQNGNNPYANNQYGNNQYGNNQPPGNSQYGYNQNGNNPYGNNQYGQNQYGGNQYGDDYGDDGGW